MKKLICLFAISLGLGTAMNAQKNSVLLYGNVGLNTSKSPTDHATKDFNLSAGVGYQFSNNWTAGITGGYGTHRERPNGQNFWSVDDSYSIAPFLRYTRPLGSIFTVYNQVEFGYFGTASGATNINSRVNYNGVYGYMYPGIGINFAKGWALNFDLGGIGYSSYKLETSNDAQRNFGFNFGQQVNAGLTWNIFCKSNGRFKNHNNREREKDNDGYNSWKRDRK